MFTTVEILELAIQIEKNGEQLFQSVLAQRPKSPLKAILTWMVEQEQYHILWLGGIRSQLASAPRQAADSQAIPDANPEADQEAEKMGRTLLKGMLEQQTFSLQLDDVTAEENLVALIQRVIEFEEDTALFYEMLDTFIEQGEPKQTLQKIIAEERRHAAVLKEFLDDPDSVPDGIKVQ